MVRLGPDRAVIADEKTRSHLGLQGGGSRDPWKPCPRSTDRFTGLMQPERLPRSSTAKKEHHSKAVLPPVRRRCEEARHSAARRVSRQGSEEASAATAPLSLGHAPLIAGDSHGSCILGPVGPELSGQLDLLRRCLHPRCDVQDGAERGAQPRVEQEARPGKDE